MAYQQSHVVVASANGVTRIMGPFTSEERARDFLDALKKRPEMSRVLMRVKPIRKPKVLESAAALRELLP